MYNCYYRCSKKHCHLNWQRKHGFWAMQKVTAAFNAQGDAAEKKHFHCSWKVENSSWHQTMPDQPLWLRLFAFRGLSAHPSVSPICWILTVTTYDLISSLAASCSSSVALACLAALFRGLKC